MRAAAINTLKYLEILKASGIAEKQAKAQLEVCSEIVSLSIENKISKDEIQQLELKTERKDLEMRELVNAMNSKFELLVTKIDKVEANLSAKIEKLDTKIDVVEANLNAKIEKLDAKIDRVEATLSARINSVETTLTARIDFVEANLTAKIDSVDANLNHKIDKVEIEQKAEMGYLKHQATILKWLLGFMLSGTVAIATGVLM